MYPEQESLILLLKKTIQDYELQIEHLIEQNNSTFEKYKKDLDLLNESISNLTQIPLEELAEIISESNLGEEERELEFNYIKSIRRLLELNQTRQTTFQITESQTNFVLELKKQLKELEVRNQEVVRKNLNQASTLTDKIKEMKKLLGVLEDFKNKDYIDSVTTIIDLLSSPDVSEEASREILYGILRYNQARYEEKMAMKDEEVLPRLNVEELKEIFNSYNYHFEDLKESLQESLLTYGNISRIKEVFNCLEELKFPRFDVKRNGSKLVALLINGEQDTIRKIVEYSKTKGIYPKDLLMIIPAMIKQTEGRKKSDKTSDVLEQSPVIAGRHIDYQKNIEFLENLGFSVRYILTKCKELLVIPNEKLIMNYRKFVLYGFTLTNDTYGELTHPALSCLLSNNFDEIVDQFIEISREGHQYIKDNMSRATTITDPKDIIFYNIYASYMNQDNMGEYLIPEGPFTNTNHKTLRLRGEITRYAGSGYENTPYRGITEQNKEEKTMTVDIPYQNKDEFSYAVLDARGKEEELSNLVVDDQAILGLEGYTDISDPLRYDFDGVLISKLKVARIYNILKNYHLESLQDSLLYAITYNSILSEEDLNKIKKIIRDRRK